MKKSVLSLLAAAALLLMATTVSARTERVTIQGSVGKLSVIIQKPKTVKGETVPMVMILHGFMGQKDGAIEQQMADGLEQAGIASSTIRRIKINFG